MDKPEIFKYGKEWLCQDGNPDIFRCTIGSGNTPREAYLDWKIKVLLKGVGKENFWDDDPEEV